MIAWAFIVAFVLAMFRAPRTDVWWAWVAWFLVCVALIAAASAVTIAERA